ncbi:MAG TPA: ATP-binding cassette domain-containing protein [Propionibacteriaceae bacterium]
MAVRADWPHGTRRRQRGLVRTSRRKRLLDEISFRVGGGATDALVGPNGTGKTTLLRIIAGDLSRSRGHFVPQHAVRTGRVVTPRWRSGDGRPGPVHLLRLQFPTWPSKGERWP